MLDVQKKIFEYAKDPVSGPARHWVLFRLPPPLSYPNADLRSVAEIYSISTKLPNPPMCRLRHPNPQPKFRKSLRWLGLVQPLDLCCRCQMSRKYPVQPSRPYRPRSLCPRQPQLGLPHRVLSEGHLPPLKKECKSLLESEQVLSFIICNIIEVYFCFVYKSLNIFLSTFCLFVVSFDGFFNQN